MKADESSYAKLLGLFGIGRVSDADGIAAAQATLSNQTAVQSMQDQARRMGAVQDAFWASKCGDKYKPPGDEMGSNFVNCSITSDAAVQQLANLVGGTSPAPPAPPATKPKWWRVVLATLAAVLLGALVVFAVARYFLEVGGTPAQYEIFAVDEPFTAPEPFTGE